MIRPPRKPFLKRLDEKIGDFIVWCDEHPTVVTLTGLSFFMFVIWSLL